jgi:putative endonuclease
MKMENFFYVYVLLCLDNDFYAGFTTDIHRRLKEHSQGSNVSTRNRRPVELIYFEGHKSKEDALRRESYFKTSKGKATLKQILKEYLESAAVLNY